MRREDVAVSDFDDLVEKAEQVPIEGWDFGWLDGRAVEDRPTWRYFDRVAERAADVSTLLEVQAGVGSMIVRHKEGRGGRTPSCQQGARSPMRVSAATPRPNPVR